MTSDTQTAPAAPAILIEPEVTGEAVIANRNVYAVGPAKWLDRATHPRIFHIAVSRSSEGPYTAYCLELPGAISEDDTRDGACEKLREAFELVVEDYRASGEAVPWTRRELEDGFEIAGAIALDG